MHLSFFQHALSIIFFSLTLLFAGVNAFALENSGASLSAVAKEGFVREVQIKGNKKIEKDAVLAKIKTKPGSSFTRAKVADDIRSIHSLGYFDDIKVFYENEVLSFEVVERPTITKIDFVGNDQISSSDLKEVVKLKEYSILDINKVKEDILAIQKHYEEKGFYLARVTHEVKKTPKSDEIELIYRVSDFDKVRIKKITFINNKRFSDDRLKSLLRSTREGGLFSFISSSGNFKESAFKQDLQILTYYYLNEGYLRFRYENPVVTVSEDKKWLFISIYVDEGEKYDVGDIDFRGDLLFSKEELSKDLALTQGQVFSIQKRSEDIQQLTEKYQDLGYAFVNVNPKMEIHDDTRIADIRYEFEKGDLVHFGEINIVGNTKTRDKVIRRELRIREGELYNGTRLRISKERVERLGYFAPGEVVFNQVTRKDKKDVVDIEISIKERSTGTVTVGMGYGSVQKFFLTSQIAEVNLFGRGQSLSLSGQWATDRRSRSLNLDFTEPYAFDTKWSAGFGLSAVSFPIPDKYLQFRRGFNLRAGHPLQDDLFATATYKFERLSLTDVNSRDPEIDIKPDLGDLSSVTLSLVNDKRNNRFETTKGHYENISGEFAGIGADKNFLRLTGEGRFYHALSDSLVFRTKAEVGHILQTTDKVIPPSEKFYLGGPMNLKGYDIFTVSPKTRDGTPLGGITQALYIAELETPLIREAGLKLVLFFDIGNSYRTFQDLVKTRGFKKDVGFGVRWFSPIGPLRFEWGFPIKPDHRESAVVFNFFIGPPF